ncbi:hypothetical protein E9230_002023 [Corynebacterium glutamicum]|nr:hypothetical protein [Corynebacterium glutamicum]
MNILQKRLFSGVLLSALAFPVVATPANALSSGSGWLSSSSNSIDKELEERSNKAKEAEVVWNQHLIDTGHRVTDEAKSLTDSWIVRAVNHELVFDGNSASIDFENYYFETGQVFRFEAHEIDAVLKEVLSNDWVNPYSPIAAVSAGFDDKYVYIAWYNNSEN